jgi:hypothetical protein
VGGVVTGSQALQLPSGAFDGRRRSSRRQIENPATKINIEALDPCQPGGKRRTAHHQQIEGKEQTDEDQGPDDKSSDFFHDLCRLAPHADICKNYFSHVRGHGGRRPPEFDA